MPRNAIRRRRGSQFGNPQTIRKNLAIRANLQIDSRESGHLSGTQKSVSSKLAQGTTMSQTCRNPDLPLLVFVEKARKTTQKSKDFSLS